MWHHKGLISQVLHNEQRRNVFSFPASRTGQRVRSLLGNATRAIFLFNLQAFKLNIFRWTFFWRHHWFQLLLVSLHCGFNQLESVVSDWQRLTGQERRAAFQRFIPAEELIHRLLLLWSDFAAIDDSLQPGGRLDLTSCTRLFAVCCWCKTDDVNRTSPPPVAEWMENLEQFQQ